jgi:hypothetical protein
VTDEELIEGLSFPVYRRVATMMLAACGQNSANPFDQEGIAEFDDLPGRSNAHSVWVTFLARQAILWGRALMPRCCHCGHGRVTTAGRLLYTEIVPSDKRLIVVTPGCAVV